MRPRPGPVRRAAARRRAGPRPGAPGHPARPAQPRPLDRGSGGSGRRPGPVRRAAARTRAGPRPRAPAHPRPPGTSSPCWTGEAGDPAAARDQFAALLPVLERVSGPEHPDTLTARANLARWTGQAGDPAAARDQFAALLPVRERVSGSERTQTPSGPAATSPTGPGRQGMRPAPETFSPRCCPCSSGSSARSTRAR